MINIDEWCEIDENITVFYRTKGGAVVHKEGCPALAHAKKKYRWTWAENNGLTDEEKMMEYLNDNAGIRPCRTCFKGVIR